MFHEHSDRFIKIRNNAREATWCIYLSVKDNYGWLYDACVLFALKNAQYSAQRSCTRTPCCRMHFNISMDIYVFFFYIININTFHIIHFSIFNYLVCVSTVFNAFYIRCTYRDYTVTNIKNRFLVNQECWIWLQNLYITPGFYKNRDLKRIFNQNGFHKIAIYFQLLKIKTNVQALISDLSKIGGTFGSCVMNLWNWPKPFSRI